MAFSLWAGGRLRSCKGQVTTTGKPRKLPAPKDWQLITGH